ncbi:unnamed protein product [Schistosoma curassoni]|uniref:HSF_DOMAIN domain-containing protein n=1 Tax=Schistosoma curassoni TaxID=6186 RepID=A0A183KIT8_9TREM|nr:unnamed protein product [Schistosoma curassoni]
MVEPTGTYVLANIARLGHHDRQARPPRQGSSFDRVFYSRPSIRQPIFDSWFNTAVIYHDNYPNFSEQNFRHSNINDTSGGISLPFNIGNTNSTNNNNSGNSNDFTWIDNGKYLFKVDLKPLSSIYTHDPILSKFFRVCSDLLPRMLYLSSTKTNNADKQKVS